MFENIGKKLKQAAPIVGWIQVIGFGIFGIVTLAKGGEMASDQSMMGALMGAEEMGGSLSLIGLLIIGFGALGGWLSSLLLYGLGTLVENSEIVAQAYGKKPQNALPNTVTPSYPTNPYAGGYTPTGGSGNDDLPEL